MPSHPVVPLLSFDEYVALYGQLEVRHEFVDGYVRAMAGGSAAHSYLAARISRLLFDAAEGAGCMTFVEGRRLDIVHDSVGVPVRSYYPDVMVVCEPLVEEPAERSPCLVVEVLSESTAAIDQIEKLAAYERIPSIEVYLVVSQSERRVIAHRRADNGLRAEVHLAGSLIRLPCPAIDLAVEDIYAGRWQ